MSNYRFSLGSTLIGSAIAVIVTQTVNMFHQIKTKKLYNAKLDITDSLNQEIGYLHCKLDDLKRMKSSYDTRNLFKRAKVKSQLKEIDNRIKDVEFEIRSVEQRIMEIRSSNSMKMLRYVEEKMDYIEPVSTVKMLPSPVKGF